MVNIHTVAVIGSGTMGAGIAEVAASHGHPVLVYDIDAAAISRAIDAFISGSPLALRAENSLPTPGNRSSPALRR